MFNIREWSSALSEFDAALAKNVPIENDVPNHFATHYARDFFVQFNNDGVRFRSAFKC